MSFCCHLAPTGLVPTRFTTSSTFIFVHWGKLNDGLDLWLDVNVFQTKLWFLNLIKFRTNTKNNPKNGCFFGVKLQPVSENSYFYVASLEVPL